ncbi:MAG: hypothetical protein ACR2KW_06050 [Rubrobacter sp.]
MFPVPDASAGTLFTRTAGRTRLEITFELRREPACEGAPDDRLDDRVEGLISGADGGSSDSARLKLSHEACRTQGGVVVFVEVAAVRKEELTVAVARIMKRASSLGAELDAVVRAGVKRLEPCAEVDRDLVARVEDHLRKAGYETRQAALFEPGRAGKLGVGTGGGELSRLVQHLQPDKP